jgi:hypothetical protein
VVRVLEGQPRGKREIHPREARIVRRIYESFVAGISPKAIAKTLNAEQIPGPMGNTWSPSTIHEHEGEHDAARQALRGFLEKIVIPSGNGLLQVVGNFGEMLKAAAARNRSAAVAYDGCGGSQPPLSATLATGRLNIQPNVRADRFAPIPSYGSALAARRTGRFPQLANSRSRLTDLRIKSKLIVIVPDCQ